MTDCAARGEHSRCTVVSIAVVVFGAALVTAHGQAVEFHPGEFRAEYDGYVGNIPVGTARLSVEHLPDGQYIVDSELIPGNILALLDAERSLDQGRFRWVEGAIEPLESRITKQRRSRTEKIFVLFDWVAGTALVEDKQGEKRIPLQKPTYDPATLLLVMIMDAAREEFPAIYTALDGRRVKRYSIAPTVTETVDTDFGELDTLRVERLRKGSDRTMILWMAPDLGYIPVRIVTTNDGEQELRLELRQIAGIEPPGGR